jgi:PhzF family phenazine biosynthesis protein
MGQPIIQVDAFTSAPFRGNPAAVCVLRSPRAEAWMQAVAREMNLSETAFLERRADGWSLRWFTPVAEVDLCGHATLASAHVLWEDGVAQPTEQLRFHTRSGWLDARREPNGIVLDFPAVRAESISCPRSLLAALGIPAPVATARNRMDVLIEVGSAAEVRQLTPDFAALAAVDPRARGVIVTALADDGEHDIVSRFFAPAVGVNEDPVTGSAHCCLGPWWAERLGRTELRALQASPRGGVLGVRVKGERVELIGQAVTVMRGELVGAADRYMPAIGAEAT